jgi:hypothetical protein
MLKKFFKLIGKPTSVTLLNKFKSSIKKLVPGKVKKDLLHDWNKIDGDFVNKNHEIIKKMLND